jgi:hypothetical protein
LDKTITHISTKYSELRIDESTQKAAARVNMGDGFN